MPVILVVTGAALLAAAGGAAWQGATTLEQRVAVYDRAELRRPPEPDPLPPDRVVQPVRIRRGATFGTLMSAYGLPPNALREAALPFYDLSKIRSDRSLSVAWLDGDPAPVQVVYDIDEDHTLILDRGEGDAWTAHVDEVTYTSEPGERAFVTSLTSSE